MNSSPHQLNCFSVVLCVVLYIFHVESLHPEEGLELLFRERSQSDWEDVWHRETHSRCREKLVRQLFWACEKDIYRLTRRNHKRTDETIEKHQHRPLHLTWVSGPTANSGLLRTRRTDAPSITNECCTKAGCTWEEYAEYCPSNKRRNHY